MVFVCERLFVSSADRGRKEDLMALSTRSHARPEAGYISLQEVQQAKGISDRLLRNRVREAGLETLPDPCDRRRRVIRVEDVMRLFQTHPAPARSELSAG